MLLGGESSYLTIFNVPFSRHRFTHLPLRVIGDAFQWKLDVIYNHPPLMIGTADDMIILGEKDNYSNHNAALDFFHANDW